MSEQFALNEDSITRGNNICEKEPDHDDDYQDPSDVHGAPSQESANQTAQYRKHNLTLLWRGGPCRLSC
jgi:hypothetical protein